MPIISMGRLRMGESADRGFSLPTPRDFRGRVAAAIPTGGIILPAARGGKSPITYSLSNLPSGLSFNATTRAVTGNPTNAHATRAVVLTATDASTPAGVLTATFEFPVVSETSAITTADFDFRGYGLSTRTIYLLALLQSTVTVSGSNVAIWRRPPQSGAEVGILLDDDGTAQSDLSSMMFAGGGEDFLVSQVQFLVSQDRVELREGTGLHFGNHVSGTLGSPPMTLRIGAAEHEISYDRGFSATAQWRRSSPDLGTFLQGFDTGARMILAVSSP